MTEIGQRPETMTCLVLILITGSGIVLGLLVFVTLLVGGSLLLVWLTLLLTKSLPPITKDFADLTEADAWVFLTDILTLLIGKEHVCREAALGSVGVLLLLVTSSTLSLGGGFGGCFRHFDGELMSRREAVFVLRS